MSAKRPWWFRAFDATSQWLNTVALDGEPNESISGRSFREGWRVEKWIDALLGAGHCKEAYLADVERARQIIAEDQLRTRMNSPTENSYEAL